MSLFDRLRRTNAQAVDQAMEVTEDALRVEELVPQATGHSVRFIAPRD